MNKLLTLLGILCATLNAMEQDPSTSSSIHSPEKSPLSLVDLCSKFLSERAKCNPTLKAAIASQLPAELISKMREPRKICSWQESFTNNTNTITWLDTTHLMWFDFNGAKIYRVGHRLPIKQRKIKNFDLVCNGEISPDQKFVTMCEGKKWIVADTNSAAPFYKLEARNTSWASTISPDSSLYATSNTASLEINILDMPNKLCQQIGRPADDRGMILSMAFSPDNTILAYGTGIGVIQLFNRNLNTINSIACIDQGNNAHPETLSFSPNGQWLVAGFSDHSLFLINMATHIANQISSRQETWQHATEVVRWSPDSQYFATLALDGVIDVWTAPDYMDLPETEPTNPELLEHNFNINCEGRSRLAKILRAYCLNVDLAPFLVLSQENFDRALTNLSMQLPPERREEVKQGLRINYAFVNQ